MLENDVRRRSQMAAHLGAKIRRRREANGIGLVELGEQIITPEYPQGVAASTLSDWERGRYPMSEPIYWAAHEGIARILARRSEAEAAAQREAEQGVG